MLATQTLTGVFYSTCAEQDAASSGELGWALPAVERRLPEWSDDDREDERLMTRMQAGDTGALEALYDRHHRVAMALAYRVLGDRAAAEDAVQDAFLAAWRRAASYDPARGEPRRWLLAIVHHRCIDRRRRARSGG